MASTLVRVNYNLYTTGPLLKKLFYKKSYIYIYICVCYIFFVILLECNKIMLYTIL